MTKPEYSTGAICGWIDWERPAADGDAALQQMLAYDARDVAVAATEFAYGAAIAALPSVIPAGACTHGEILAAVLGRVRFGDGGQDGELAASAEVALQVALLYQRHGEELLAHLHGPFAIAVVDRAGRRAILAVDRVGVRGMCFALRDGQLVFGTTADSVVGHPAVARTLSEQGLFDYLYTHVVPSPRTIYAGVEKLLPGERLVLRERSIDRGSYRRVRYGESPSASLPVLEEDFRSLLRIAVRRAIGADEVAAFLSGGTDSSTVTGMLAQVRNGKARTYSIGFESAEFDETAYARIAARRFGADARFHSLRPEDVLSAIPLIAAFYDEPFGNESAVPTYHCARLGHEDGIRVMLGGDGGDEIFGGNARYAKQKVFELYLGIPVALRRSVIEPLAFGIPGAAAIPPLRKARSYIQQANVPLPDRIETYNFFHRLPLAQILEPDFLRRIDPDDPLRIMRDAYREASPAAAVNGMLHLDLKHVLGDNDLRKVSRMCEATGVEARFPLLDDDIVEFAARLPPRFKVRGLRLRWFFKRALREFLPVEILRKRKHGFGLPFGLWLREDRRLAELAVESATAFGRRGFVQPRYIEHVLAEHRCAHATYFGTMIWVLMIAEQWLAARRL